LKRPTPDPRISRVLALHFVDGSDNRRIMATEEKVVRYTITRNDLFAFQVRGLMQHKLIRIVFILMVAYLAYMGFSTPPPPGHPEASLTTKIVAAVILFAIASTAMFLVFFLFLILIIWTQKFKNVLGEHELRLTDAGMLSRSANSETMRKWTGLFKVKSVKNHLFLYVNETAAVIVPKRCFMSAAEAQSFEQMIRDRAKLD
jgi:hypothetical protein